jgi:hypothetical protein
MLSNNDSENIETSICVGIPGVVSWWPGDGNAFDVNGENHGTLQNGASFSSGKVGQAISFDGEDDYVQVNGTNINELQELTIEMWVQLNSMPSGIIGRFVTLNDEKAVLRYTGTVGDLEFYMKIDDTLHHIWASVLETGAFHHVAGTYDGNVMRLYYDGVEVGNNTISGNVTLGTDITLSSAGEPLDGLLDEVTIYDRPLTPSEIYAIYTADSSGKCKPPDSITITNPTASTLWRPGTTVSITWTATGSISQIDIEILKGSDVKYFIEQTSNDGSYLWNIPEEIDIGTGWWIRISDSFDSSIYDESSTFQITRNSITVTNPTSSDSYELGAEIDIKWLTTGTIDYVDIKIYKENTLFSTIAIRTDNDGSYSWTIPSNCEPGTNWKIRITDADDESVYDWSDWFEIINISLYVPIMIIGIPVGIVTLIIILKRKSIVRVRRESKKSKKLKKEEQEKTKIKKKYSAIEQLIQEKNYTRALKELEGVVKQAELNKFRDVLDWAHKKIFISGTLDKLYTLFKTSQSVNIYDLMVSLDSESAEIFKKLGNWSKIFEFTVSGGFIAIKKEDVEGFTMILEKSYDQWVEKEKKKKILVFISYSLKDSELFQIREIAQKISFYDDIEEVLYCEEHTKDNFIAYMDEYIGKCDVVLLFCSPNALTSVFVRDEWMAGRAMQKPIIPVFTNTDDIPPLLRARVGVEFDANNLQKVSNQLYELIRKRTEIG